MEIVYAIIFIILCYASITLVKGVDFMKSHYPEYKGEDLFGEEETKEITPEILFNDKKREIVAKVIKNHKAIEQAADKYSEETFKWPKNKNGEDQAIPVGQSVPNGYRKHIKATKKPFMDGALSETAKNYWYELFRNENN